MDATLVHLAVHHFPVVLSLAGGLAGLTGIILRRPAALFFAAVSLLLAGAAAPVAYISGRLAVPAVTSNASSPAAAALQAAVAAHEASGLAAAVAVALAGFAAAGWLRRRSGRRAAVMVLLGLASTGLAALAGWQGGQIRHPRAAGPSSEQRTGSVESATGRLEDRNRRDVLVRLRPQVGQDVVQLDDHAQQLFV